LHKSDFKYELRQAKPAVLTALDYSSTQLGQQQVDLGSEREIVLYHKKQFLKQDRKPISQVRLTAAIWGFLDRSRLTHRDYVDLDTSSTIRFLVEKLP
jgi:hypothetical protein